MKSWAEIGFEIETTADGSPSLRLLESVDPTKFRGESMHHSGGAWAETHLIYGNVAKEVLRYIEEPHFMIVGLGMGYIELAIAREALLAQKKVGLITSYESVPELREYFWLWLQGRVDELHPEVLQTYDWVVRSIISGTHLSILDLKRFLSPHFPQSTSFHSELGSSFTLPSRYHCIFYDAFSSKTTPHLWEEAYLVQLLNMGTTEKSVFSTYACRVGLRSALSQMGFEIVIRPGFKSKRNSTLGLKNFP